MHPAQSPLVPKAPPWVVLIDDDTLFRQMIRYTLQKKKGCTQIDEFSDGEQAVAHCRKFPVELVIVDLNIPGSNGFEICTKLKQHSPHLPILMMTGHPTDQIAAQLISIGVTGYLEKTMAYEHLMDALDAVLGGGLFFSAQKADAPRSGAVTPIEASPARSPLVTLSPAELQIARHVVAGRSSKEIANELNLSSRTVDNHRANIMRKIGVNQATGLVRWCLQNNIGP